MSSWRVLLLVAALLELQMQLVCGSIYEIKSTDWIPAFQRAEKLFASNKGPLFAHEGNASVTVDVHGVNVTSAANDSRIVVVFYHTDSTKSLQQVQGSVGLLACSADKTLKLSGVDDLKKFTFVVQNTTLDVHAQYQVQSAGWIDTQIVVCAKHDSDLDDDVHSNMVKFAGTMQVKNPYGYLPAALYGLLPFSGFLTIGYAILDCFFILLLIKHRDQIIKLHYGIFMVLIMGTVTSVLWFFAFFDMNETGTPVCCPYPPLFLTSVVLDVMVRTLARIILLVVCMGYGIVRNRLGRSTCVVAGALSVAYFISGVGDETTRGTANGAEFRDHPTVWSFVQLVCNLTFILWIQYSLESMLRELQELKQTAKLEMYKSLGWALAAFIVFFTGLTIMTVLNRIGMFELDVDWEWMQLVAWPVMNFTVAAAMSVIWRPTKNSSQFAFSMQLPMTDDTPRGVRMTVLAGNSSDEEDEDEAEQHRDVDEPESDVAVDPDEVKLEKIPL